MLFQPSNVSPSSLSGLGQGTVDCTAGITVSWQVNGDSPMTAYKITIYQNDAQSTEKYTTGKITLSNPFQPKDGNGNQRFFSTQISASTLSTNGIVNGYENGYKMLITQWWSANDYVEQTSASAFITRSAPTLTIDQVSDPTIEYAPYATCTATYTQAQGDPVSTVSWSISELGNEGNPIKQTGPISTQVLSFSFDGMIQGCYYVVSCTVVTSNGVSVSDTAQFSYTESATVLDSDYYIGKVSGSNGLYLYWLPFPDKNGLVVTEYRVYRIDNGANFMSLVAVTDSSTTELVDYSVASNKAVQYFIRGISGTAVIWQMTTSEKSVTFPDFSIVLCDQGSDGNYHVQQEYVFGLGVETGQMSNNNDPSYLVNFTRYPSRQPQQPLYKTGNLKGYIGKVYQINQYFDTVDLQNEIYEISNSQLTKFYKSRKGDVLMVETSSPITMETMDESPLQPLTASIAWTEVGKVDGQIISVPSDGFWPIVRSGKPVIISQPQDVVTEVETTATFTINAIGAMSYNWQYRTPGSTAWNNVLVGNGASTYSLTVKNRHNGNIYRCAVSNYSGESYSQEALLTILPIA